jgi:hypothetical protein
MRITMLMAAGLVGISLAAPAFAESTAVPPYWRSAPAGGSAANGGLVRPSAGTAAHRGTVVAQGPVIGTPLGGQTDEPGTMGVETVSRGSTMNPTGQANW